MKSRCLMIALVACGGCYIDSDRYVREQSDLLCNFESECDKSDEDDGYWEFGVSRENGESCQDARERELDRCTAACEYDDDWARECMRELRAARRSDECSLNSDVLVACSRVFYDCEIEEGEEPLQCEVREPRFVANDSSCSIAPAEAPPPWAIALLGIAIAARRRRGLVGTL